MIKGEIGDGHAVLTRVHSECLIAIRHMPPGRGGLDIAAVLRQLHSEGIRSVVAEGGPRVITSLVAANMADRAVISISPEVRGHDRGGVGKLGNEATAPALRLTGRSLHLVGDTIIVAADISRERRRMIACAAGGSTRLS